MFARILLALILILTGLIATVPEASAQSEAERSPWRFTNVEIEPDEPTAGSVGRIRFTIEDQEGNVIPGLRASGILRAPSTAYDDIPPPPTITTIGRELEEPGRYEVAVALNQAGRWWIEVRVDNGSGDIARYDHFTVVDAVERTAPATTADPVFLRGETWDEFYRIDPDTGSVVTIAGDELFQIGHRWWIAQFDMQERGSVSSRYGGTWRLSLELRDGISGREITTINLGDIRASVYSGSRRDPAIATAITIAEDGSAAYIYWARQLGEGWIAHLAEADPLTGEIRNQRVLNGAIASNGFWAEIFIRDDGHVVVAEQVVELAAVSGYRLSLLERGSLELVTQYRRSDARDDLLTHCMLAYPGPTGVLAGEAGNRFSLCAPPELDFERVLLIWNPVTATAEHLIHLGSIGDIDSAHADGVVSPDGQTFYAVNTRTMHVAEIDLETGAVLREKGLFPPDEEEEDPSTLDRFFDWVFGAWTQPAVASVSIEPGVTISPDGQTLYVISEPENREPGLLVIDIEHLEIINSLKTGESIDGLIATSDNRIVVIQRENSTGGDALTVLDSEGVVHVSFTLPGYSDIVGSRR